MKSIALKPHLERQEFCVEQNNLIFLSRRQFRSPHLCSHQSWLFLSWCSRQILAAQRFPFAWMNWSYLGSTKRKLNWIEATLPFSFWKRKPLSAQFYIQNTIEKPTSLLWKCKRTVSIIYSKCITCFGFWSLTQRHTCCFLFKIHTYNSGNILKWN